MTLDNNKKIFLLVIRFCDAEYSFICNLVPRISKEGLITSYRVFYRIQIGLNIIDRPILELINNKIGNLGKIYDYPNKKESTLSITTHENMKIMIENVFSKYPLLTSYQATRDEKLRKGLTENITKVKSIEEFKFLMYGSNNIEEKIINPKFEDYSNFLLDYWLVGFLNGEVSFTYFKGKKGNLKPKVSLLVN